MRQKTIEERFWSKVDKTAGCWNWTGCTRNLGYGHFVGEGRKHLGAHRVSWEFLRGPIPPGFVLDHICRNPGCVNPDHLEVVTQKVNCLRGISKHAVNARKTHCVHKHPLSGENLYIETAKDGSLHRKCKMCMSQRRRDITDSFHKESKRTPSKEELERLLKNGTSWLQMGRTFGMSDNGVRKWARKYGLSELKKRGEVGLEAAIL